jgi:glycosyltransferase involved in cell wall biosynthesis
MKISIAIPAFNDKTNTGFNHLSLLLSSISSQNFKNIEVVVSDHSDKKNSLQELCLDRFKNIEIIYKNNTNNIGFWGANINNSIKNCNGDLIKCMQQDDFFIDDNSLSKINNYYNNNSFNWAICGGVHTDNYKRYYHKIVPKITKDIYRGNNKLGGVSSIVIKNCKDKLYFNEKLNWMGDCDYYIRSQEKYGDPFIIEDSLVVYKQWSGQFTNILDNDIKKQEELWMIKTYEK